MIQIIAFNYIQQIIQIIAINESTILLAIRTCQALLFHLHGHKTTYQGADDIR